MGEKRLAVRADWQPNSESGPSAGLCLDADGSQGLERFRAGKFDLVLTDRAMPQMNGDQLAVAIKDLVPSTPVILLTGFVDLARENHQKPGAVDLMLPKPITQA